MKHSALAGIVAAALILTACGGGGTVAPGDPTGGDGGGGGSGSTGGTDQNGDGQTGGGNTDQNGGTGGATELSLLEKWQRYENGNPTLDMTPEQALEAVRAVYERTTHSVESMGASSPDGSLTVRPFVILKEPDGIFEEVEGVPVMEHNGIPVGEFRVRFVTPPDVDHDGQAIPSYLTDVWGYIGWLEYTYFSVASSHLCTAGAPGCSGMHPEYEAWGGSDGSAYGRLYSGTKPAGTGPATWTGVMFGMERPGHDILDPAAWPWPHRQPDVFLGDAQIRIDDLAAPTVPGPGQDPGELMNADVSFTNIWNVTDQTPQTDMTWENLAVADGLFGSGSFEGTYMCEYIVGMFNGPGHQEVGGHFWRDGIKGAFGASRQ